MEQGKVLARLTQADKQFGKKKVLQGIDLKINAGTIVGLIGPSGAGKSTTIKCLLGMEKLDRGTTEVFQTAMPNRAVLDKIGYMGQSDALYQELTAKENLVFFGHLMGKKGATLKESIQDKLAFVQLEDATDQPVKTFSGGMKRRLSLAITLLADPQLLILDEPTVGIDPRLRIAIWNQLRELAHKQCGIVITTHVMDEAELCDQVGLIIDGCLLAFGTPNALKEQFSVQSIEEVFLKAEEVSR
ncbi:ABC transporter ATP-binding protein [Enterococcus italicus]|uniref:ABC transporter ATP-binding protein n=1 Tax=Enterococcus italicus TaxID=246144 RepID=UPI0028AE6697|nr:ABC transporter ATP-binding protein [Enterococcus italicus]